MNYHKYTMDRFDGDYAIFLKRPEETEQLLIHRAEISIAVKEGDIVRIQDDGVTYHIEVLNEETTAQKQYIQELINQLKNKK